MKTAKKKRLKFKDGVTIRLLKDSQWSPYLRKGMVGTVQNEGDADEPHWTTRMGPFPFSLAGEEKMNRSFLESVE